MGRPRSTPPKEYKIPEYYLEGHDIPEGFQEAFNHAKSYRNPDKASLLFAETFHEKFAEDADTE